MGRFSPGDRVSWVSRSGMRREGAIVEELPGKQWAVRPDGCSAEQVVDGSELSLLGGAVEPARPRVTICVPLTPEQRSQRARHAALSTSPEHRRERSRKAGLASALKAGKRIGPKPKPKPRPVAKPVQHGTASGYRKRGCRCVDCKAAHSAYITEYHRRRKAEALAQPETIRKHGTCYGYAIGCRCEACCVAKAAAKRKSRRTA